jgi:hypothetical protein
VMAVATMLMIGLRYQVGGDWLNYVDILNGIGYRELTDVLRLSDPAYATLNWISDRIGFGIWFVNLVCGAIFTWGLTRFAREQTNPWLVMVVSVPYLITVVAMGYTRQGVAMGFILAGLADLERSTMRRFIFYIICAAAFHKSAVVVLPLVALSATRQRFATIVILMLTAVLLYYLFIQASSDKLMTNYVSAEYASQGAGIRVAMNLPPALIFLIFQKRFRLGEQQKKLWRNFAFGAIFALLMLRFTTATAAVDRLALYLIPLQMFVLSRLSDAFPSRGRTNPILIVAVIAYSALIQFVWLTYAANAWAWLPYRFYPFEASDIA